MTLLTDCEWCTSYRHEDGDLIELFYNPDGKVYCLLDAPDEEAVRSHHAALGLSCGAVHEVKSLL